MRSKNLIIVLAAFLMVALLAACGGGDKSADDQDKTTPQAQVAPDKGKEKSGDDQAEAPEDKTLKLTVPSMERVEKSEIPTGEGSATQLFKEHTAVHLDGTGYPWDKEANVYIAGHRLGYPGTDSYLAFNDIDVLQNGDEVILEDAEGRKYTYEVFNTVVVEPTNLSVLDTVEGKNIVSLQSCTLPDYSDRIIVQAELKDKAA